MGKKSVNKKKSLGKMLKRNKRVPALAVIRTHRRVQYNKLQRDWRRRKLRIKG
jgi:ribosomal protein L39E